MVRITKKKKEARNKGRQNSLSGVNLIHAKEYVG
jgi:hypothetical protein